MSAYTFGRAPRHLGHFAFDLREVMYYLYLPVKMSRNGEIRLPANIEQARPLIERCVSHAPDFEFAYVSARKGWATPDSPLNRPGWHTDGFGTDDVNVVWWAGPGTRFSVQPFVDISDDHTVSMRQFEEQVRADRVVSYPERGAYLLDPGIVHATPVIGAPGCMRQYVKVSLSNERYNLENNSHNYLFDYAWPMSQRMIERNSPAGGTP